MKILTTSTSPQTLKIIPREYQANIDVVLRDNSTNTSTTYSVATSTSGDYMTFDLTLSLVENRFYDMTCKFGSNVIYKDKIFCTDQVVADYTVNENQYTTENSYDNDYIIL
jgi:hypothetical protein